MCYTYSLALCALGVGVLTAVTASGPSPASPIILRIRKADGSMGKIQISNQESTTLSSILSTFSEESSSASGSVKCSISNKDIEDTDKPISEFQLKNGSLITITPPKKLKKEQAEADEHEKTEQGSASVSSISRHTDYDPYPDLARSSHSAAARRSRALSRLPNKRSMSYSDIANLHSYMHLIEPQPDGPIKRIYMCSIDAQRFKENCTIMPTKKQLKATKGKAKPMIQNRCAVLFGTVNKERVDQSVSTKARTSLSTPLYEMKMCDVVKVHAVWEPPQTGSTGKTDSYDASNLIKSNEFSRAKEIGKALGMSVVGWIYSYSDERQNGDGDGDKDDRNSGEDSLPVWGTDIVNGAKGQIANMQELGREVGSKYVTLALDSKTGATEAFQLSNVSVQMVAEGVLAIPQKQKSKERFKRFVTTQESISIDNKETKELDSVLCLVNTAMLSHEGRFSGEAGTNSVKKAGGLTAKKKKSLLARIEDGDDIHLLGELSDFSVLMALDRSMSKEDMRSLCSVVAKFSRGHKKGIEVEKKLKLVLKNVLAS